VVTKVANDAIHALNKLHSPPASSPIHHTKNAVPGKENFPKQQSLRAVGHVYSCAAAYVTRVAPFYENGAVSVDTFLNGSDSVHTASGANSSDAVPLVAAKVALPGDLRRVKLMDLLPPDVRSVYEKENPSLLLPPEQIKKARKCLLVYV
jgi:hypothetical protein